MKSSSSTLDPRFREDDKENDFHAIALEKINQQLNSFLDKFIAVT